MHDTRNVGEESDSATTGKVHDAQTGSTISEFSRLQAEIPPREKAISPYCADAGARGDCDEEMSDLHGGTRRNSLSEIPPRIDLEEAELGLGRHVSPKALEAGYVTASQEKDEVIIVDWDGPDDPSNPKKCVYLMFCRQSKTNYYTSVLHHLPVLYAVGLIKQNGSRQSSSLHSPSYRLYLLPWWHQRQSKLHASLGSQAQLFLQ